jgi:cytochrome d ubiquinol oxidase subunit II
MFSGFYIAFLLLLLLLIVRVVSFEWRSKSDNPRWRNMWMWVNAIASAGIALIWGIGLANLLHGVPLDSNGDFTGTFWDLFSGYTVLAGIAFMLVFAFHGAAFLTLRTTGDLWQRAGRAARRLALPAAGVAAAFLIWTIAVAVDRNDKDVFPVILPAAIAIVALVVAVYLVYAGKSGLAFSMTAIATIAVVATLFTGLYPRVMVSSPDFGNSLTVANASSAHYTLAVMSVVALIVFPIVLLYQGWTYYVFRARVTGGDVEAPEAAAPETA